MSTPKKTKWKVTPVQAGLHHDGSVFTHHTPGHSIDGEPHGLGQGAYVEGPGEPYYQPVLVCLCGFQTVRCETWEGAGRQLDAHIKDHVQKTS